MPYCNQCQSLFLGSEHSCNRSDSSAVEAAKKELRRAKKALKEAKLDHKDLPRDKDDWGYAEWSIDEALEEAEEAVKTAKADLARAEKTAKRFSNVGGRY